MGPSTCKYNLIDKYPDLPASLHSGFNLHIPVILRTQTPPNSVSLIEFRTAFDKILERELSTGRYVGPFSEETLFTLLGPFQSSPISIIPKAGKAGKFRVIQNFSFPIATSLAYPNASINSNVNSDDFPCTWGTFDTICTICTIIRSLPPGSQAATRDVTEAYCTVPPSLHPSQWAAAVVRLPDSGFCVDTCVSFAGIGPLAKWVDDHLFFRIRREHLLTYNKRQATLHALLEVTGRTQSGGRLWYRSESLDEGEFDTHAEDYKFPLRDLSQSSLRSEVDAAFAFAFADIDQTSRPLGTQERQTFQLHCALSGLPLGHFTLITQVIAGETNEVSACYLGMAFDDDACASRHSTTLRKITTLMPCGSSRTSVPQWIGNHARSQP